MGAFDATGVPPARPEVALKGFNDTYVEAGNAAAGYAGYDIGSDHLSLAITANTSSVVVSPGPNQRVIITGLIAHSTQNAVATPNIGTLAEEGSTSDLVVYTATAYGNYLATNLNIALAKGKDLIHFRVQGATGAANLNAITVMYKVVAA